MCFPLFYRIVFRYFLFISSRNAWTVLPIVNAWESEVEPISILVGTFLQKPYIFAEATAAQEESLIYRERHGNKD